MIFKNHEAAPHFIVTMRIKRSYIGRFPTKTGQLKHFETVETAISRPCTHSATDCFFHARLLTHIFPYGRILAGQVGAFAPRRLHELKIYERIVNRMSDVVEQIS